MADEYIDIVDSKGHPTGEIKLKSEAHQHGLYHDTVHIWLYTKDGELLFQKRSNTKAIYPSLWDVSVAGHISAGETKIQSAIREVEEEIGLQLAEKDLEFVDVFLEKKNPEPNIYDNEFHYIFFAELTTPIQQLSLQKEEVDDISYTTSMISDFI